MLFSWNVSLVIVTCKGWSFDRLSKLFRLEDSEEASDKHRPHWFDWQCPGSTQVDIERSARYRSPPSALETQQTESLWRWWRTPALHPCSVPAVSESHSYRKDTWCSRLPWREPLYAAECRSRDLEWGWSRQIGWPTDLDFSPAVSPPASCKVGWETPGP